MAPMLAQLGSRPRCISWAVLNRAIMQSTAWLLQRLEFGAQPDIIMGVRNTKGSQTLEGSGVRVHKGRGKGTILKPSQTPDP